MVGMLETRERNDADCEIVTSWIENAAALNLFTGLRLQWPLDPQQLAGMSQVAGFSAWVMVDSASGSVVGHFDLAIPDRTARLGRVILDPDRRGLGLAHALVGLAEHKARQLGAVELVLNVIDGNLPAIRTYENAGFHRTALSDRPDVITMTLTL